MSLNKEELNKKIGEMLIQIGVLTVQLDELDREIPKRTSAVKMGQRSGQDVVTLGNITYMRHQLSEKRIGFFKDLQPLEDELKSLGEESKLVLA